MQRLSIALLALFCALSFLACPDKPVPTGVADDAQGDAAESVLDGASERPPSDASAQTSVPDALADAIYEYAHDAGRELPFDAGKAHRLGSNYPTGQPIIGPLNVTTGGTQNVSLGAAVGDYVCIGNGTCPSSGWVRFPAVGSINGTSGFSLAYAGTAVAQVSSTTAFSPVADGGQTLGTASLRWSSGNGLAWNAYLGAGDANAQATLGNSAGGGFVSLGPGGATTLNVRLQATAAGTLTADNNAGGAFTLQAPVGGSLTFTQATRTTDAATANITIAPQAPFATATLGNRTPGSLVVNTAAPTNGGTTEARFTIQRAGAFVAAISGLDASPSVYSAIWLGGGLIPSSTNYAFLSNGSDFMANAPTTNGHLRVANGTDTAMWNASGVQLGSTIAFGGGVGVLGVSNATTVPTTNPSGGSVLYADGANTAALVGRSQNGVVGEMSATGAGTANSQTRSYLLREAVVRTTLAGATTLLTFATTSGTSGHMTCRLLGRTVVSGGTLSVGDTAGATLVADYRNVAGVLTQVGATTVVSVNRDANFPASTFTISASGTSMIAQVASGSAATVDWEGACNIDVDCLPPLPIACLLFRRRRRGAANDNALGEMDRAGRRFAA